jgi:ATP-dependent exoDNAse (exonuclease V) beta subunit
VPVAWHAPVSAAFDAAVAAPAPLVAAGVADTLETRIGTVTHQLLEQLVRFGSESWSARAAAAKHALAAQLLVQGGVADEQLENAAAAVLQCVDTMLADERGRWLLRADHAASAVEWELLAQGQRYVIDRSFVDADNVRWIVDYKSTLPRADETLAAFAAREVALYRPQLETYRALVGQLDARPIRTALYFPRIPLWQEIVGR